ncbi:MAG: hypothetical protein Tsb002_27930 [Wenzhouxiangellaceae bacterium]
MKKRDQIKALKDSEFRDAGNSSDENLATGTVDLQDEALVNISGGCVLTTRASSCVPPNMQCP